MPDETIDQDAEFDPATAGFAMPEGFGGTMDEDAFAAEGETAFAAHADAGPAAQPNLDVIMNIPVTMQVVLGSTVMPVANLMKLGRGAVVKLDTVISDPVDLMVNGRVVARGEVVVLENENQRFGITLTEIVSPTARQPRSKTSAN